jgi:hypothetical protein
LHVCGPWNIELVQLSRNMTIPLVSEISKQGYWALIVQVSGSVICTPDALVLIKQGADRDISEGRRVFNSCAIAPETGGYN